jgi:hypothetical protein
LCENKERRKSIVSENAFPPDIENKCTLQKEKVDGWIRWNEVSSCEVVGGEKALKSSGFISISGIAENDLKILFFVSF